MISDLEAKCWVFVEKESKYVCSDIGSVKSHILRMQHDDWTDFLSVDAYNILIRRVFRKKTKF